jgi:hypothetical protein
MIIFDLDGTLANCEHRCHFVDPRKNPDVTIFHDMTKDHKILTKCYKNQKIWKPDWKAFYEACDKDTPIQSTIDIFKTLSDDREVQIWSGRCESVRHKTELWLWDQVGCGFDSTLTYPQVLKMRPIGDNAPDEQLKERWLDEIPIADLNVEFVFDDLPKVIRMWRRRGIFVFNCSQHDGEF